MYWITNDFVVVNCNSISHKKCFVLHSLLCGWLKGQLSLVAKPDLCHCGPAAICAIVPFVLFCSSGQLAAMLLCAFVPLCVPVWSGSIKLLYNCALYHLVSRCSIPLCATGALCVPVVPPCVPQY